MQARKFIDDHGGSTAVARAIGVEVGTVRVWRSRNILPRTKWPEITLAFDDVTLATLLSIEAADKKAA